MKALTTFILFSLSFVLVAQEKITTPKPLEVVNSRMDFYNKHDFKEFIKLYSADVEVYTYPDELLATGIDNITSIFEPKFIAKSIQVEIISQMFNGDHVINHEIVSENGTRTKYISIYEVKGWFDKECKVCKRLLGCRENEMAGEVR